MRAIHAVSGIAFLLVAGVAATQMAPQASRRQVEVKEVDQATLMDFLKAKELFLARETLDGDYEKLLLRPGQTPFQGFVDLSPGDQTIQIRPEPTPGSCEGSLARCQTYVTELEKALAACEGR